MVTKLNDIIVKIPLPPPNKRKMGLRTKKDIYRPIDYFNIPKTRHSRLPQSFRVMQLTGANHYPVYQLRLDCP